MTAWKALIALSLTIPAIATIYLSASTVAKTPSTTPLIVQAKPPSQLLRTLSGHAGLFGRSLLVAMEKRLLVPVLSKLLISGI